jgi:hypothetical protein
VPSIPKPKLAEERKSVKPAGLDFGDDLDDLMKPDIPSR